MKTWSLNKSVIIDGHLITSWHNTTPHTKKVDWIAGKKGVNKFDGKLYVCMALESCSFLLCYVVM